MLKTRLPLREPHVRQYIIARYGNNSDVIGLTKKSMLGVLTEIACEKVGYRHVLPKAEPPDATCITLLYPDSMKNHFIHPSKLSGLEKLFSYLFRQSFLEAIEVCQQLGISDYEAVDLFMDKYGITEEMVSADTLRKKWRDHQRYMQRKTEQMLAAA